MSEPVQVETTLGRVPVWGQVEGRGPVVLGINGAFPLEEGMAGLVVDGADTATLHLPGMWSPVTSVLSLEAFAQAFDEVVAELFWDRPVIVVGASTGAVVALAMKARQVRGVVAAEPFFSTSSLWPLLEWFLRYEFPRNPDPMARRWVEAIFGLTDCSLTDRDYRFVLERQDRPVIALAGSEPLHPRRPVSALPSLMSAADRALLPPRIVDGGHELPMTALCAAARELVALVAGPEQGRDAIEACDRARARE